jgi:hypothetical protein
MLEPKCLVCGDGPWICGRWCANDPQKRNGLIFKADGTVKTPTERGLGWNSPPLIVTTGGKRPKKVLAQLKAIVGGHVQSNKSNIQSNIESNTQSNKAPEKSNTDFDKKGYQREYMRKRREALKARKKDET